MSVRLHERIAFDSPSPQSDGQGGMISGWTEEFEADAGFTWLRGGETVMAARLAGRQPLVMRVRKSSNTDQVTTGWRIRNTRNGAFDSSGSWTGPVYNIRSIVPTDDRRWYDITAESGVAV